jgi:hypothetical protein
VGGAFHCSSAFIYHYHGFGWTHILSRVCHRWQGGVIQLYLKTCTSKERERGIRGVVGGGGGGGGLHVLTDAFCFASFSV